RGQPQPPRDAARLLLLLARAVHAAHEKGIVHRDLKPSNVLLAPRSDEPNLNTAYGCPKIADFGLAKYLDSPREHSAPGAAVGTPAYMAPEQTGAPGSQVGPATDVWALGAMLYELLTGQLPFPGPGTRETLEQIRSEAPEPPRRLRAEVPLPLEAICLRCLEKAPGDRYPSAAALAEELRCYLDWENGPAPRAPKDLDWENGPVPGAPKKLSRRRWVFGPLAGAVVLAGVLLLWLRPSCLGPLGSIVPEPLSGYADAEIAR